MDVELMMMMRNRHKSVMELVVIAVLVLVYLIKIEGPTLFGVQHFYHPQLPDNALCSSDIFNPFQCLTC